MSAEFCIDDPNKVKFTLSVTLELHEWMAIRQKLRASQYEWPAPALVVPIEDMIRQAERTFYPAPEAKR